jgi:hypothetical protein
MGKGDPQGGRPRIEIDMELLANMVGIQCTATECAGVLNVSEDTLDRRLKEETGEGFAEFYKKHSVVLSDECEPVSVCPDAPNFRPRRADATRQVRRFRGA